MITVLKLFLINEIGPIQPTWTKSSIGSRFSGSRGVQMNRPSPRPLETGEVKVAKIEAAQDPVVKAAPKKPVGFGLKPSGIVT